MTQAQIDASRVFMAGAERSATLYDLSVDYIQILDMLESGEDDDSLMLRLDELSGRIAQKAESIGGLIAHLDGIAAMRRAESERLRERAKADERSVSRLKAYLLKYMQATGQTRIETARFTFSARQNPPAVEVLEEMMIPKEFIKTVVSTSVDKRAITDHFKATGEVVPGVEITRGTRLDIR